MHFSICLTNLLEHPSPLWEEAFGFLVASHCAQTSITSHGRHPTRREKNWPVGKIAPRCEFPISSVALLRANCSALSLSLSLEHCCRLLYLVSAAIYLRLTSPKQRPTIVPKQSTRARWRNRNRNDSFFGVPLIQVPVRARFKRRTR